MVGENDTIRRNLIECNFKQERSRFCLSFLSHGWASVLSAYRSRQRGGMDLIEIHIFFRNKHYSIPSFFHYYLNRLQFKFHKIADNVIVETKICNAHLHRVTIILKRNHRYFKHQHKIFIEYYIRQRKHLVWIEVSISEFTRRGNIDFQGIFNVLPSVGWKDNDIKLE